MAEQYNMTRSHDVAELGITSLAHSNRPLASSGLAGRYAEATNAMRMEPT